MAGKAQYAGVSPTDMAAIEEIFTRDGLSMEHALLRWSDETDSWEVYSSPARAGDLIATYNVVSGSEWVEEK